MPKMKEVKEKLLGYFDEVSKKKNGNFVARKGFFYTHGATAKQHEDFVKKAFPDCEIIDSQEVWKAFRGGASLAHQSHWFVEFTFPKELSNANLSPLR